MKMVLEDNFPPEDFCKQKNCENNKKVSRLRMYANLGVTDKKIILGGISDIKEKYCEKCSATQYHRYLIKHPSF